MVIKMKSIIKVCNVTKTFPISKTKNIFSALKKENLTKTVVDDISFSIKQGSIVAFLGQNGAGKSTTIKMLTGILKPTKGQIKVNGLSPYENYRQNAFNIGVVFGQRTNLWWDLAAIESFKLLAKIYQITDADYKNNLNKFADFLDLDKFINIPVRKLSLGERMRCELAAAFLHNPPILFLDEPTIGLDFLAKDAINKFLQEMNKERKITILLTTHDLEEVETLCKDIIVIENGKILLQESLSNFKSRLDEEKFIVFDIKNMQVDELLKGSKLLRQENNKFYISYPNKKSDLIEFMINKYKVDDISLSNTNIKDILKTIYTSHKP